ncbi:hypothetical protein ACFZCT_05455 [Streptomyces qaidamensis]
MPRVQATPGPGAPPDGLGHTAPIQRPDTTADRPDDPGRPRLGASGQGSA